jgi:hypothetical protein
MLGCLVGKVTASTPRRAGVFCADVVPGMSSGSADERRWPPACQCSGPHADNSTGCAASHPRGSLPGALIADYTAQGQEGFIPAAGRESNSGGLRCRIRNGVATGLAVRVPRIVLPRVAVPGCGKSQKCG